ncbi:MAG: hypothetical protein AAGD07_24530 [Planctomycetota bacterium]
MFDAFALAVAIIPLSSYLLVLGTIRVLGKTLVLTGARDWVALFMAMSGFVVIGPVELFFPRAAAAILHGYVWIPILILYVLIMLLVCLTSRPRIVVYGRSPEQVFEALRQVGSETGGLVKVEPESGILVLDGPKVHMRVEGIRMHDATSVLFLESQVLPSTLENLTTALQRKLTGTGVIRPRQGWGMLLSSLASLGILVAIAASEPSQMVASLRAFLFR